ncbi:MAG: BMP family ABC transporter substrate-binding protein, partial [Termitinemataceae bacterium]
MKRVVVAAIATLAVFSMAFVSCTQKKPAAAVPAFRVGLVTDIGGIDDKSFNQGTWEGIVRFAKEAGLKEGDYKYLQSKAEADYIPNLSTFADEKLDLIVAPGFLFEKAISEVADKYPNTKLLLIDSVVTKPNVVSAVFAEHEGSFLVGVAAGLKAKA